MKKIFVLSWLMVMYTIYAVGHDASCRQEIEIAATGQSVTVCNSSSHTDIVLASSDSQVSEFFSSLFNTESWPPRWQCGEWSTFHGWMYIISDIIIWFSYFMIPLTLGWFVFKKDVEPMPFRSVIMLFIAFILACGLTHLIDAAIFWWPVYRFSALVRLFTAAVSLGTVFALIQIAPKVMKLKSPEILESLVAERTAELKQLTIQLQNEIEQRQRAERKLIQLNNELEEKTKGLEKMNVALLQREQELIKSEEKIKDLNHQLEKTIKERTTELKSINHELESFTYSVSHDLRAPLRAIDGYAQILEEDYNNSIDAHGKHLIAVITRNARYMGQLIDDLLEFSRISRSALLPGTFHSAEEVRRMADELKEREKDRKIEIDIKPLAPCRCDVSMLRLVWINLIGNALKYTGKKDQTFIEIGSTTYPHEIQFYIKDNGVGFDMEYTDKLFGVFQRLHKKEEFPGTGVGLALVKRILEKHGGRIWTEAKLNEGATFYFALPC